VNESLRILEEKIAYLERHVTEQDKAMLEFSEEITRLRREILILRSRVEGDTSPGIGGSELRDERPPHY
jgi:SlyX protein